MFGTMLCAAMLLLFVCVSVEIVRKIVRDMGHKTKNVRQGGRERERERESANVPTTST